MAIDKDVLDQLLAGRDPGELFAKDGLIDELKKALSERMLSAELDDHLENESAGGAINRRNGTSRKTVLTGTSKVTLEVPRDRAGTFDPKLIAKYQRRFPDFDDKIISMYARGMTVREIRGHLEELYGIDVSPDLISTITDAVLDAIGRAQGVGRGGVEVWFADEARVGQKNKITRRWARRGTRPAAPQDQRTASTYIFGAICPNTGAAAGLILPWCNIEAMGLHLAEIAARVTPGRHCALLVDQAGWHMSDRLVVPPNITIVPLPPKCPELNPVENVWQFMRNNWLSNRIFKSYDDIVDHCCHAWNKLVDQPWRVMSIGLRQWAAGHAQ